MAVIASRAGLRRIGSEQALADEFGNAPPRGGELGAARFRQQVHVVFRTAIEALLVVDDDRRYLRVNEPATRLLGASQFEIIGRRIDDFTRAEDWAQLDALWAQFRERGVLEGNYDVLRGDGSLLPIFFRADWRFGPDEHLIAATSIPYRGAEPGTSTPDLGLTRREREILLLASEGLSLREIAEKLFLSPATVKTHFANIYKKLRTRDRVAAVAKALRSGVIR